MSKTKKYDYRAIQDKTDWVAEIIRRVTSRKVVVSKRKAGFTTESDAMEWGKEEIKTFVLNQGKRNQRDSLLRKQKEQSSSSLIEPLK